MNEVPIVEDKSFFPIKLFTVEQPYLIQSFLKCILILEEVLPVKKTKIYVFGI